MFPRRIARVLILAAFASPAAYSQSDNKPTTPETAQKSHSMGVRRAAKGIPNFGEVTPNLFRGAQPNEVGIDALKKLGVDIVVDMRRGINKSEESALTQRGMKYVSIPSRCPYPRDEPIAQFLEVIRENPGKKVFVHCRLGDDRTGIAVASYRMAIEGWSADEAMKEMKAFGFSAVHHAMCPGLADYENSFPHRYGKEAAFDKLRNSAEKTPK